MIANPLQLTFIRLPLSCPQAEPLRAQALRAPLALADELAAAEAELTALRAEADAMRAEAEQQVEAIREAAVAAAYAECEVIRRQAREDAVADAVAWMVSEAELEAEVARQLMQRWRPMLADVLAALLGQAEQNEQYLSQLARWVLERLPQGRFRLSVSVAQHAAVVAAFAHLAEVSVEADADLACGQAVLDNGLVRVRLDWPAHRDRLLRQLAGECEDAKHG
ncbi:type III secretion protein [Paludibacterium purpuratum]|uniref:Type III secretion protein L n=1 Tax=Paludibacterium purpuratum TaxID=1144873 RepID=A0A4R7B3J3_9NEIS|nr:type III secretion protein [Paludibacterium purpuratum]TDR76590.1 hypothetical protein DFP86_11015 [Paludibacterium purpuratum]